ncbi:hypothetical protein HZ326_25106 [Fusarium oxysporum f. sp. albedinis]|nr:hypothetical protein HZ326_25106 [Fusarium oxysporum f. sp. albedinis]
MWQHASRDIEPPQVHAAEEIKRIHGKLDIMAQHAIAGSARTNPRQSFADIARMSPTEGQNGGVITYAAAFIPWTGPVLHDRHLRSGRHRCEDKKEGREMERWRCAAVIRGARNANIIKVICRDEAELHMVREAALGADMRGAKILKQRLYPVKVNGANRSAVLDSIDNLLAGENDARRLLEDQDFHLRGESARTSVFEPRADAMHKARTLP